MTDVGKHFTLNITSFDGHQQNIHFDLKNIKKY